MTNFKDRIGTYKTVRVTGESYKAYIPQPLPPHPALNLDKLYIHLDKATQALAELNSITKIIPNPSLFIYMYVRKEALLSSQIEGTQSSFSDLIFFENDQQPHVPVEDVEEVSNYVAAINYGLKRLEKDLPLSLRLFKEIHAILLRGGRGALKSPGEFRTTQNWIGGSRPGNALFVPPSPDHLMECLGAFEKFLNTKKSKLPPLIRAGLAHVQFETIHPFLDGNGRLGRLLITLLLCEEGLLHAPVLYLSLYLKKHRTTYYNLLQEVRTHGTWETWLEFFLDGVHKSAQQAVATVEKINALFVKDIKKINALGRAKISCLATFECMKKIPQISAPLLAQKLEVTTPTARSALNNLVELGILEEMGGNERSKMYRYHKYLSILEEGTEPL